MITYKLGQNDLITNQPNCILRSDNTSIPFDENNSDYQAYLAWVAKGNIPTPADPIVIPIPDVTAVQIRLELNKQGLRTQAEDAVASGSQDLKDKWQFGNIFSSADSDIQAMATSLNITQEQLDALFTDAATL